MNRKIAVKNAWLGFLGGLVGTVLMDIIMFAECAIVKMPLVTNYTVIGAAVGRGTGTGFILHFIVGPILGLLFGVIVSLNPVFQIHEMKKGIFLGILAGIVTIPFGCVPTAILSHVPIMKLVGFSTIPHLVWGSGMGCVVGYGLTKSQ